LFPASYYERQMKLSSWTDNYHTFLFLIHGPHYSCYFNGNFCVLLLMILRVLKEIYICTCEGGEDCIMRSFVTCTIHQVLLGRSNQGGWDGRGI
jgi:hypothetical protein